ncbi:MAG: ribonuclease HI family protein [Candidatus Dadabacteria bacterium]|nr:ribonuclease HI family protein [Candidatus Dadabacteria bacterium]
MKTKGQAPHQRSLSFPEGGEKTEIFIDGASRGNPGIAGIGVTIRVNEVPTEEIRAHIGTRTNNQAEYEALLAALRKAKELKRSRIHVFSDSLLLANQINGLWRVKDADIRKLYLQAKELLGGFDEVTLTHIRRELNAEADRLANEAIDDYLITKDE